MVIRFYGDLSGNDRKGVLVAAGYLATAKKWRQFEKEWIAALREAKIKHFHATDFFSCRGEFKHWEINSPQYVKFARRFTAIAERHAGIGVAIGLPIAAFNEHVAPLLGTMRTPHRRYTPKMMVVTRLLSTVTMHLRTNVPIKDLQVAAIFEEEDGIGEAIDYFTFLKKRKEPWTDQLLSVGVAPKDFHPLQAADLLAHEAWRHITGHFNQSGRAIRKSFERLLKNQRLDVRTFDPKTLPESLLEVKAWLAGHPEGLTYPTGKKKP